MAREMSQEPRAVRRRAATVERKAAKKAAKKAAGGETVASRRAATVALMAELSGDPIVVNAPVKSKRAPAPVQAYHCGNCKGAVTRADSRCPTCEESLLWSA
jgi:hypothetical protein